MARAPLILPRLPSGSGGMSTRLVALLVLGGVAAGVASASALLKELPPFGAVAVGPWRTFPLMGSGDIDPYARAILIRAPHLPMAAGEGLKFVAFGDGQGRSFSAECRYRLSGLTLPSRGWSLAIADPEGRSRRDDPAYLTDADMVVGEDGRLSITVSRRASAGNWLPSPAFGRYTLVLRFYDTPVSSSTASLEAQALPAIERLECGA